MREGLLPTAQKAAASRAIYTEHHVALLRRHQRVSRSQGLPLRPSRSVWRPGSSPPERADVDLVAEQTEQTRQSILTAAARLFVRKGYKRTRVADIIKEVGITPPVFYGHFPSKQELFVEAFGVFVGWMRGFLESRLADEPDPAARDLARVHGYLGVQTLSPDLMSLVRSEALHEDGDAAQGGGAVVQGHDPGHPGGPERAARSRAARRLPASDELMAFGLLGGVENIVMRASWDDRYSTKRRALDDSLHVPRRPGLVLGAPRPAGRDRALRGHRRAAWPRRLRRCRPTPPERRVTADVGYSRLT